MSTTMTGAEMIELPFEVFDLEKEHDEQIRPIVDALIAKCQELDVAFHLTIAYSQEADGTVGASSSGRMSNPHRTPIVRCKNTSLSR